MKKPPIGVVPRTIWNLQQDAQRATELLAAVNRYVKAKKQVPTEWFRELTALNEKGAI